MNRTDTRTEQGKENSREGARKHMQAVMADPVAWKERQAKMLASRKRSMAALKRLKESGQL